MTAAEITPPPASADLPALKNIDSLKKPDRSKIISNLLLEVQEYDGRIPPRFFIQVAWRCLNTLDTLDEQDTFVRRIIAQKLRGEAQLVAQRVNSYSFHDVSSALEIAFGQIEQSYQQLSDQRNSTCQGLNESLHTYIKRYEELYQRLLISIDALPTDYRDSIKYLENKIHIERFIESLNPDIEVRLANKNSETLREAFAEALRIDKKLRDQNSARNRRTFNSRPANNASRSNAPIRYPDPRSNDVPRQIAAAAPRSPYAPQPSRGAEIQFNNRGTRTLYCPHCKRTGHTEQHCFILHPELKRNINF